MRNSSFSIGGLALAAVAAIVVTGCDRRPTATQPVRTTNPTTAQGNGTASFDFEALYREQGIDAGVPISLGGPGSTDTYGLAQTSEFATRSNPFALLPQEYSFNREQWVERILQMQGGYSNYYVIQPEAEAEQEIVEPTPAWRLSGIIIGEGISALLDMGPGEDLLIRPGTRIPDTEWVVVSITEEYAILERGGNRLPRRFIVPLAGPLEGMPTAPAGGGGGGGTGAPQGGTLGGQDEDFPPPNGAAGWGY